jgi:hypothetical protein
VREAGEMTEKEKEGKGREKSEGRERKSREKGGSECEEVVVSLREVHVPGHLSRR